MEDKRPAKLRNSKRLMSGRYSRVRSVMVHWRSIPHDSTDRKKGLETSSLRVERSMRAV
jgi:hypothetical protein